jgi:hypothetical protein
MLTETLIVLNFWFHFIYKGILCPYLSSQINIHSISIEKIYVYVKSFVHIVKSCILKEIQLKVLGSIVKSREGGS